MSEHVKRVVLEPTEIQNLKLQLAVREWELNYAQRSHMKAEIRFYKLAADISGASLEYAQAEESRVARAQEQSARALLETTEQIKTENAWAAAVTWDPITQEFSAPEATPAQRQPNADGRKVLVH